jgi:hypothetical protein
MEKLDLFEATVRYLAVKPLKFKEFDFAEAQEVIKQDKQVAVTFIGDHNYFEKALEAMVEKVILSQTQNGSIYINVRGQGCTEQIKRKLFELSNTASSIIIFGDKGEWPRIASNVKFSENEDIFTDNHQRFFIYHSGGFNIALLARHEMHKGKEMTEAIITNDPGAVSMLGITIGTKAYPLVS